MSRHRIGERDKKSRRFLVMMGTRQRDFRPLPESISLEELVPKDNFYRRLEAAVDLSFVRELVRPLYAEGGRPSVDPVVFFRLQLVMSSSSTSAQSASS
jgi:hypothetical protein